jgi:hypothetical protein
MIIIDNSVEYMLKAYGDSVLVPNGVIGKTKWEQIKASYRQVLNCVAANSKFSEIPNDVFHYHDKLRNPLYHEAAPLSVEPKKIDEYMDKAKTIMNDLFQVSLTSKQWDNRIKKTVNAMSGKAKPKLVEFFKTDDGLAKMQMDIRKLADTDAILLMIYGFGLVTGSTPKDIEILGKCLNYSGHSIKQDRLSINLSHLRTAKKVNKGELTITSKGRDRVKSRFLVPS